MNNTSFLRKGLYAAIFLVLIISTGFFIKLGNAGSNSIYELYPTKNIYNFLKLNTKTGQISQVQYSMKDDGSRCEVVVNAQPLADEMLSEKGRFKLYSTENIYNFLLLDRNTGRVWQVQWHIDHDKRGIVAEITK